MEVASSRPGATASQVALNWVRSRPGVSTVLVGARNDDQLRDNLGAASWSLSPDEIEALDRASQCEPAYPNSHQRAYAIDRNPQTYPYYL